MKIPEDRSRKEGERTPLRPWKLKINEFSEIFLKSKRGKYMRKLFLIALMLFVAVASVSATITRRDSLGIDAWMFEDDSNIWLSPAQVNLYPRMIWGEIGSGYPPTAQVGGAGLNNQWGGFTFGVDLIIPWVWGIFIGQPYGGNIANVGVNAAGSDVTTVANLTAGYGPTVTGLGNILNLGVLNPDQKVDIIAGMDLADNMKLGIGLSMAVDSASTEYAYNEIDSPARWDGKAKNSRVSSETTINVGAYLADIGPFTKVDAVIGYLMPKVKNTFSEKWFHPDYSDWATIDAVLKTNSGARGYSGTLRGIMEVQDDVNLIASAMYARTNLDNTVTYMANLDGGDVGVDGVDIWNVAQERNQEATIAAAGVALNVNATAKTLVIAGASVSKADTLNNALSRNRGSDYSPTGKVLEQYHQRTIVTTLPINLAIEHQINNWLISRAGVEKNVYESTEMQVHDPTVVNNDKTDATDTTIINDPSTPTVITLGLGVSVSDRLSLDMLLQQEILFSGTFITSGIPGQAFNTAITASYRF